MSSQAYRLLGFAVWHAGKWYVRRRVRAPRALLLKGLAGTGAVALVAVIVRRASA
jgi:hypothetical protein